MNRILTGVQSTGTPHIGNILGAILPAIELSNDSNTESFFFIADMHSLTQIKDDTTIRENTYSVAATWLACGLDVDKVIFYRQSDIPQVCELSWYLSCFFQYNRLKLAHSFKDKSDRLEDVNAGLFTYPILMASDILLYSANYVPVGKDQVQHIQITRDIASKFNTLLGETFTIPKVKLNTSTMIIPGVDGEKMSKSRGNTIDIFTDDTSLKKQIMNIKTNSTPFEESKDPDTCNVFKIYSSIANEEDILAMRNNYLNGNYGYGSSKKELLDLILIKFKDIREKYNYYINDKVLLDELLYKGSEKAKVIANSKLAMVRSKLGFK